MASNLTPAATGGTGTNSGRVDASNANAPAKKEKRNVVAAAAMAPRMQSQVQKWAKMTAELGGGSSRGADDRMDGGDSDEEHDGTPQSAGRPRKKARTGAAPGDGTRPQKSGKRGKRREQDALPYSKQLRAPHRRDRYVSFGIGAGLGRNSAREKAAATTTVTTTTSSLPPTCLLCLVRFESRQQLRDHESLSSRHKRQLRDPEARKLALQRFSRIAGEEAAAVVAAATKPDSADDDTVMADNEGRTGPDTPKTVHRPPLHIKRLPRRRGDLAPTYTSYAVPLRVSDTSGDVEDSNDADALSYHACLLCRRRFRSRSMLRLHERESALHRARTRDPASVAAAVAAVNKVAADEAEVLKAEEEEGGKERESHATPRIRPLLRLRPAAPTTAGTTTAQYRDRARERRLAFGGHTKGQQAHKKSSRKDAAEAAPKAAAPSKGAALLSKMGWTAGQGLGAQGGGLTEAIAPAVYRSGVGLGAQGGKLGDAADVAARRTESTYADFVQQTRDTARQRLMALDREEAKAAAAAAAEAAEREAEKAAAAASQETDGTVRP
ncbi:hypothetical protein SCUCBS95973_008022 [Sporothrix curviconia]|uniref:G-patch domain-containing protein n=1 Tax=Sporothrix curviconia TaxID=1260050 RepID=A0ABP0CIR8_9PEZI